ncbi:hypothetical protein [Thioclava nitratireducens]|uniref:hypothetical protein n=1 Tax=Thioclava nitratireducens TaxID=1915078 RepID=UPI0024804668|nr:hypothetical protein [Thioclava nitratireducens]WGT50154.1 hypothetical protein P0N61_17910 [Thioclava nitratireducens]
MTTLTGFPDSGIWGHGGVSYGTSNTGSGSGSNIGYGSGLSGQIYPNVGFEMTGQPQNSGGGSSSGGGFSLLGGIASGVGNLVASFVPKSTPAYKSGYNVTGGVVTSPGQVTTGQIDGQTGWADALKNSLGNILQTMGAAAAAQSENQAGAQVQPAAYQTGGNGGIDPIMILLLVGGAGLAVYAATK